MSLLPSRASLVALLTLCACGGGTDEPDADVAPSICERLTSLCGAAPASEPTLDDPVQVVPSPGMPSEVISQQAHNNLDVEWHEGRLFFAFRTAPNHFAGEDTALYVVSSDDLATWRFEGRFFLATDLREPQLVSFGGRLLLYFAVLGTNALAFEPQGSKLTEYRAPGEWSPLEDVFDADFIPWRIKVKGDGERLEVTGYTGGASVYETDGEPIKVQWLKSVDGRVFEPVVDGQPVVLEGGVSETDLVVLSDGRIVAVSRNEAGDADGFGMKICKTTAADPGNWQCVHDPRKYDSPLLIEQADRVWLIGRRNVTADGHYDLGHDGKSQDEKYLAYQLAYWDAPKRCALWEIDPDSLTVTFVLDLPSRGDTCFPEALPLDGGRHLLFNYTSPLDGDADPSWATGQSGATSIYRITLSLPL